MFTIDTIVKALTKIKRLCIKNEIPFSYKDIRILLGRVEVEYGKSFTYSIYHVKPLTRQEMEDSLKRRDEGLLRIFPDIQFIHTGEVSRFEICWVCGDN